MMIFGKSLIGQFRHSTYHIYMYSLVIIFLIYIACNLYWGVLRFSILDAMHAYFCLLFFHPHTVCLIKQLLNIKY